MSGTLAAVDLDRTIIYSAAARLMGGSHAEQPTTVCVEVYQGKPAAFVTTTAARLLGELVASGVLVPATTRTLEQYRRVVLPGPTPRAALCANGGRLLLDGVEDGDFSSRVTSRLAASGAPAGEIFAGFADRARAGSAASFVSNVRDASGLFCYAIVDRAHLAVDWIEELTTFAGERGWRVSIQGRKLYVVPRALSKGHAARDVAQLLGADRLLAAGDSLLDADLLEAADAAIRPAHGELAEAGWIREHVDVTSARGLMAGEEIVRWIWHEAGGIDGLCPRP